MVAEREPARRDAIQFTRVALKVMEPKPTDVEDAFRLYHAVEKLLEEENANAITIDCLGGFARGELPAYPCVAWSKLNDRGLHGVCEGDLESTFTQMLFAYYSGKPGFVSDPVIDTKTNTIIHAHCVAATRMDGPKGPAAPYIVRSHMEDNKGVSLQVNMRVGLQITLAKLADADTLLVSTGRITATPDLPRGCRTKVATKVRDASKMLENYSGSLHRVLFYGDHLHAAHQMGHLFGLKVVEET
jgi:L-fucose isomerase-like protein